MRQPVDFNSLVESKSVYNDIKFNMLQIQMKPNLTSDCDIMIQVLYGHYSVYN